MARKMKQVTVVTDELDSIICNRCGKEVVNSIKEENIISLNTMHEFEIHFGYGSKRDGDHMKFDLCEDCIEEIIRGFKIKPDVKFYL